MNRCAAILALTAVTALVGCSKDQADTRVDVPSAAAAAPAPPAPEGAVPPPAPAAVDGAAAAAPATRGGW